ncbi:MAG: TonB-dependent receptor [Pseudomonadota bacterium]
MKYLLTTASALALALPAAAQEAVDLGTEIISASQTPVEAGRTGTTVEVITEEELQEPGTTRVIDRIGQLPGVTFSGNGPTGTTTSVSVRGLPARYVPVIINGIDVTDPGTTQTSFNFGALLTPGFGQVEVLKGSQSAIYGSNAIAGVITLNAPTLDAPGSKLTFSAEVGSYDTYAGSVGYVQKTDRAEFSFTLSHFESDGFSAADENLGNTEPDGASITTLTFAGKYAVSDVLTIGGSIYVQDSDINIDDFGGAGGDADRPFLTDRNGVRVFADLNTGFVTHTLAFTHMDTERRDPTAASAFFDPGVFFSGTRTTAEYQGTLPVEGGTLTFGASYARERSSSLTAGGVGAAAEFDIASVFVEGQFALSSALDVSLAVRGEDHSEFGSAFTGRAALSYRLSDATTLRASLGSGFRSPSLFELFSPAFGNAALTPEESISFDIGIEHKYASGAGVKATLFYTEIDDLIGFVGGGYIQTPGTSVAKGLELSGVLPLAAGITLTGAYTYTDTADANGNQLRRVPEHELSLGITAELTDRLTTEFVVSHYADRAPDGFPASPVADYTMANALISYEITDTAQAYLRVENIFNEEYQTSAGFGTSDRAVYFGVRAEF